MSEGEQLDAYIGRVQERARRVLTPYLLRLSSPTGSGRRIGKEIHDSLWGTISLHPAEVVVVDSPVYQRLRQIRQLGVAHYLYPSANHSRFEHSLGTCFQITRVAESINIHSKKHEILDDATVRLLRLAALCHDVGHGFMSHVSDNAVRSDPSVKKLLTEFKKQYHVEVQLSELAAHAMVTSPAFRELLALARTVEDDLPPEDSLADQVSALIIGISPIGDQPLIQELISGPFDADKLDYLPRDARFCGVPVPTDVGRLIQKLRAVRLKVADLDEELRRADPDAVDDAVYIGISPSGASALDEVSIGRSLMFDKVYRHHKVRAAEAMVASVIDQIGCDLAESPADIPHALTDDEFFNLKIGDLERRADDKELASDDTCHLRWSTGLDILQRLKDRQMFVRAYAFSQHLPDETRSDNPSRKKIENMMRDLHGHPSIKQDFINNIVQKVQQILGLLGIQLPGLPDSTNLAAYIRIDPADATRSGEAGDYDGESACLIDDDGTLRRVEKVHAQSRGWSEAYIQTHDIGYVFTTTELAPYVFVAAKSVAYATWGVETSEAVIRHAKQDLLKIHEIETSLSKTQFYKDMPYALRPTPRALARHDANKRIDQVRSALQGYQGMQDSRSLSDVTPPHQKIKDWVTQFGEEYADCALYALQHIKMLNSRCVASAFQAFITSPEGQPFKGASVCPIGDPKDGSATVAGAARAIAGDHHCNTMGDEEALRRDEPIIYIDDFIGRGSSTISIMSSLLGKGDHENLNEHRERRLSGDLGERLCQRKIAFLYTAGMPWRHENKFEDKLANLGLEDITVFVHLEQEQLPTLDSIGQNAPATYAAQWSGFVERCRQIGADLMSESAKCDERALGYGNAGLMICTTFNTPTAALTCLWKNGKTGGFDWFPLLPRFAKQ